MNQFHARAAAKPLAALVLLFVTARCSGDSESRGDDGGVTTGGSAGSGASSGSGGSGGSGASSSGSGGSGASSSGSGGSGEGGSNQGGTGGFRNPCEPWPMWETCLTIDEVNGWGTSGSGGTAGSAGAGGSATGGSGGFTPMTPEDCPLLPTNTRPSPYCADPVSGPATRVQAGRCCWTCRRICG